MHVSERNARQGWPNGLGMKVIEGKVLQKT